MFTKVRGSLWLQLFLLLGAALVGISGGAYGLIIEGLVSIKVAFLLCASAIDIVIAIALWAGLAPLRKLADAASAMSEGQSLTVRSTSSGDIGRIARALRSMQISTQAAMARMGGEEHSAVRAQAEASGSWPVVTIGSPKTSWVHRVVFGSVVLGGLMGGLVCLFITTKPVVAMPPSVVKAIAPETSVRASEFARGVTKDSITLGMSAPFSGAVRSLSEGMKLGLDTAIAEVNAAGGINGRKINLIALDNGYEEKRAIETTRDLIENRKVFGLIGSVGTPTVKAVLPYVVQNKILLFGPLTGSPVARNDPPDRYVFNVRASYGLETAHMINYLLDVKHLPARSIVVFAQNDSFGDAGYEGAVKTLRKKGYIGELLRVGYERNTIDVGDAVTRVLAHSVATSKTGGVRAAIVVATATASASFTAKISSIDAIVLNVSFVDAGALALEFKDHWPGVGNGVIVTQVVPHFDSGATGVIRYREALKSYYPDKSPGFSSLEGYMVGELYIEGLRRVGPNLTTERMIDTLEKIQDVDLGYGVAFSFGVSKQASQKVWGTVLTDGVFKPLDSEWTE